MIQDSAIERFRGGSQSARRPEIGLAWTRITAWMIVRKQDTGALVKSGIDDDRPQRKVDAAGIAVMPRNVQAAVLIVYVRNPKALAALTFFKAAGKE